MLNLKTTIKSTLVLAAATLVMGIQTKVWAESAPANQKEWTFLVFINGHNNLSSFGDTNIRDMEKTGSTKDLNIVVEWGSTSTTKTKRLLVQKSTDPSKVTSPSVMEMDNHDMGDYKNLINFIEWGVRNYPAKHYFISVWNHGSGWNIMNTGGLFKPQDISYDDSSGNHITTEQLGIAMHEAKKIIGHNVDIYGSDACLMAMVEVAGEMKGAVDYFVGSQETEPGEGWPYAPFIQKWAAKSTMTPAEVSVLLSKEYLKAYSKGGVYHQDQYVTFSAWDMSQLDGLYSAMSDLGRSLVGLGANEFKQVKTTANNAESFTYSSFVDVGDFAKRLSALPFGRGIPAISAVQSAVKKVVLSTDNGSGYSNATGISVWIPTSSASELERYDGLQFSQATKWNEFVRQASK